MSARKVSPQRALLGAKLQQIRASRFRSGAAMAQRLGWQQTRVNKLEHGYQLPSDADLDAWRVIQASLVDLQSAPMTCGYAKPYGRPE